MLSLYFFIAVLLSIFLAIVGIPLFVYNKKISFKKPRMDIWFFLGTIGLVSMSTILLYLKWGASEQLSESYAVFQAVAAMSNRSEKIDQAQVIQKFLEYLTAHPHDAKGWYLLGRLYLDQGEVVKGTAALKHSFESDPQNVEIMAQYAQALYFLHHQKLTTESLKLVQSVLSQDPKNTVVLNLLAMDAFLHHRYALAITYWERLRSQYTEGTPEFKMITEAIEVSRKGKN